jgi:formate-dependent nitrite reductase cytochrome c552 subunit
MMSWQIRNLMACIIVIGLLVVVATLSAQLSKTTEQKSAATPPLTRSPNSLEPVRSGAPRVATGTVDAFGRPISVSCASCHANFKPNLEARTSEQLREFHQGLSFAHGKLTCLTCHNAKNYNLLHLAGEHPLDFSQTQTLCSQCHSKQSNDYDRGAHGGMNGHWNLARGTRVRKLCIDCHDPHSPAFPAMVPTFRPRDRFLKSTSASQSELPHE